MAIGKYLSLREAQRKGLLDLFHVGDDDDLLEVGLDGLVGISSYDIFINQQRVL